MKIARYLMVVAITISVGVICFQVGQSNGQRDGKKIAWQVGYDKGHHDGLAENGPRINDDESKLANVTSQYNQLSDNYNNLRNAIIKYAGTAGSYQPSTHISCTSNDIGSYTFTNCY
jgi:hypothetical protein